METQTFALDGVGVAIRTPYLPRPEFTVTRARSVASVATSSSAQPFGELTLTAVPFGVPATVEQLPLAEAGAAESYSSALRERRAEQGNTALPAPDAELFGQRVRGSAYLAELGLVAVGFAPTLFVEWVAEA